MFELKIVMGGKVPKSYYLAAEKPEASSDMEQLIVAERSNQELEFQVSDSDAQLRSYETLGSGVAMVT